MNCPGCKGGNVEDLEFFWRRQPEGSPTWLQYAPPSVPESRALAVLGVIAVGIVLAVSGSALAGVLVAVAGLLWGAFVYREVEAARASLAEWKISKLCLACPQVFVP